MVNFKVISRNVGSALLVSSLFMFLSIIVSMANGNDSALAALIISFTLTFIVGIFPFFFVPKASNITLKEGYLIVFLSWLLSFIFGMLPYALWGDQFTVINAWFESVSGFTTTGATILDNIEALPNSLLFWRSSTHFIGGLGVVVFLLLVVPSSSSIRSRLTNMELSSLSKDGYKVRANKTVYIFAYVYIGICIVAFISYMLCGMSFFDAINHAMSVCATGGFSTRNMSIGYFDNNAIYILTIFFMYVASIHFGLVFLAIANLSFKPLKNPVLKYYTTFLVVTCTVMTIIFKHNQIEANWFDSAVNASFHVLSYTSTTGFAIADNAHWPLLPNVLLLLFGIHCGMAGSTTGGLKSDRILVLAKTMSKHVKLSLRPSSVQQVRIGKTILRDEDVYPHVLYMTIFMVVLVVSYILCLLGPNDTGNSLIGVTASLSNVGPAFGDLGTFENFNGEPVWSKLIYTLDMFLGRVEIYPILSVCMMIFSRNRGQ